MYLKTESILPIQSIPNTAQQSLYAPLDIKHQEMLISADNDVNIRNDSAI